MSDCAFLTQGGMAWGRNLLPLGLGKKERDGPLKERLGDKEGKGKRGRKEEKRTALPSLHFHQKGWKEGAEEMRVVLEED